MKVLVIDIGGTNVKFVATGHKTPRRFPSGLKMTPRRMVAEIEKHAADWKYDVVSIGYPGVVKGNRVVLKPKNLGPGTGLGSALIADGVVVPLELGHLSCRHGDNAHAFLGGFRLWEEGRRW